jgi:hypothetical protein
MSNEIWDIKITSYRCPFKEKTRDSGEDYQCFSLGRKEVNMLCREYNCPNKASNQNI